MEFPNVSYFYTFSSRKINGVPNVSNFSPFSSRKINGVPNGEYIESDKFSVTAHGMDLEWQLCLYPSGK